MNIFFRIIIWPFRKLFGRKKEPELEFGNENFPNAQQQYQQNIPGQLTQQNYRQQYGSGEEDFLKDYGKGYSGREQDYNRSYQNTSDKQEIIISKLEVINAKLDNLNQRLQALERGKEKLW